MFKFAKNFAKKVDGNVAITAGIVFRVLAMISLGALEYSSVLSRKQSLENAANTAALSAVNEALLAYKNSENVDLKDLITAAAKKSFMASAGAISSIDIPSFSAVAKVEKNKLSVEVNYSVNYKTIFGQFAGKDTIAIAGDSRASATTVGFTNFTFLFDVSASMGIGATRDEQLKVVDASQDVQGKSCGFACHIPEGGKSPTYDAARAKGAVMRVDVAREAALNALDVIEDNTSQAGLYTVGAYVFDNDTYEISDPNDSRAADMNFVSNNIRNKVTMQTYGGGTDMESALAHMASIMPNSGTGRSPSDRNQVLVVFTDGVNNSTQRWEDRTRNPQWGVDLDATINNPSRHLLSGTNLYTLDQNACNQLKAKGVEVYFIYTEYLVPSVGQIGAIERNAIGFINGTLIPITEKRMETCSGDKRFVFQANTPAEIKAAFEELVVQKTKPLHLF